MDQAESIQFAKKYLEDLLTFFEVNVSVEADYHDGILTLDIPSTGLNSLLIGRNAETLRSLQYMVSTVLRNQNAAITRINVDVADYKKQRALKTEEKAKEWIEEVRDTGDSKVLHLNPADRRVVHHVAAQYSDVTTYSEGEGRDRRLIIAQASS